MWPLLISGGLLAWRLGTDPDLSWHNLGKLLEVSLGTLLLALLLLALKDAAYTYRLRTISRGTLSWKNSYQGIVLWEFANAITPSVVGGTAPVVYLLYRAGLSAGRALATVMVGAIMDNLFFIVMCPLVLLATGTHIFPELQGFQGSMFGLEFEVGNRQQLQTLFWFSYGFLVFTATFMSNAVLFRPRLVAKTLARLARMRLLRRWRMRLLRMGMEMVHAAANLKGLPWHFWARTLGSTFIIWTARFAIINVLISGYNSLEAAQHFMVYAQHTILWVLMLASPTPGSSGTAEFFFEAFFGSYLGPVTFGVVLLWRFITYYPYLLAGAFVLPRWLRFKR